jgi:hypothetical protein
MKHKSSLLSVAKELKRRLGWDFREAEHRKMMEAQGARLSRLWRYRHCHCRSLDAWGAGEGGNISGSGSAHNNGKSKAGRLEVRSKSGFKLPLFR